MFIINTLFIALSLSMDAFAVSVCKGLGMKKINWRNAFIIGAFFGAFQAIMPLIGWAVGRQFARFMTSVSHWVAFGLLVFIGAKMLIDAFKGSEEEIDQGLDYKELFILAVATSIDALAVGVVFAFASTGISLNGVNVDKYKVPSVICHLVCGWSILFGVPALLETMDRAGVYWLIGGGAAYTVGSILYGIGAKKKYIHCVFHVFCLIGTFCHFWAVYSYLL